MNRNRWMILFILAAAGCLTGCSVVTSKTVAGERIQEDLRAQFNGIWDIGDNVTFARYQGNGDLRLAGVEWKGDRDRFELDENRAVLTRCGDQTFINYRDPELTEEYYVIVPYTYIAPDQLLVWMPKIEAFAKAVTDGEIKGKVEKGDRSTSVTLDASEQSLCEFIKTKGLAALFDLQKPAVFRKK